MFVLFILVIVLYVLLVMVSDYPVGIFKLLLFVTNQLFHTFTMALHPLRLISMQLVLHCWTWSRPKYSLSLSNPLITYKVWTGFFFWLHHYAKNMVDNCVREAFSDYPRKSLVSVFRYWHGLLDIFITELYNGNSSPPIKLTATI